jgi:leucine dehydrogenase
MEISEIEVDGYERVARCRDQGSGLHALIAVHDTTLGPALGGMRMLSYPSEDEALFDVLRLSRGMTYKSAVAETGLGGGKSVVIGDPRTAKSPDLFRAMGRFVESLGGRYITAQDMNIGIPDLEIVRQETRWVTGLKRESGSSGNPSPYTAKGCLVGMRAVLEEVYGKADFHGKKVLIQGVGAVGGRLAEMLAEQGAKVLICDINEARVEDLRRKNGFETVPDTRHLDVECDIYSPCARGATLNDETIPRLKCKAVAGCANNQLLEPRHARDLMARGILYAPDYVINAGGIINVSVELLPGGYDEAASRRKIERIYENLRKVFEISRRECIPTNEAAARLAEQRLAAGRESKVRPSRRI